MGRTFHEFAPGETLVSARRTVTETDIVNFAGISGDFNPLHMDHEFGRKMHGGVIAHGALTYSMATGLFNSLGLVDGTCIAFLGLSMDFVKVVHPGDTICLTLTVSEKRLSKTGDKGVVTFDACVANQREEPVLTGRWKLLLAC